MIGAVWILAMLLFAQQASIDHRGQNDLAHGRKIFESQCASCHGIDGSGGRGSPLNIGKLHRAATDQELREVIAGGIERGGMPGFWWLPERDVKNVAQYVRSLGRVPSTVVAGDVNEGRRLFESKGGCAECHIVNGSGGWLGPELSDIGARRSAVHIRKTLLEPATATPGDIVFVSVATRTGQKFTGRRLNEDTFSIQFIDAGGRFISLRTAEAAFIQRIQETPMPSYRTKLTKTELDDIVKYLASLTGK